MQEVFIKNRKNQRVAVIVEEAEKAMGLAFVMHGLGGFKEQPHLQTIAEAFKENNYTVVRFDTTNTIGGSDGDFENATLTNYYEDLEDVIEWASAQKWYIEPFVLAGHSLGGISTALYAENFPEKIKALAPIGTVVSGALSVEAHKRFDPEEFRIWEETGWLEAKSASAPGVVKRLKWSHIEDRLKYNLLPKADKLIIPVLLVVGENDTRTPLEHQKILYDALPGPKELHVIKGSPHTYREPAHLQELKNIFDHWIRKI